jgi:hypothetical protein
MRHTAHTKLSLQRRFPDSIPAFPTELTVEIAEILPCKSDKSTGIVCDGPPYSQNAHPGASIGYRGSDSSSSIAAFFEATLTSGGTTKVVLTNHHVAFPTDSSNPFPPQWDSASTHDLLVPSPQDLKATHRIVVETILSLNSRIQKLEARDTSKLDIKAQQELDRKLADFREQIESYETALPTLVKENAMWDIASLAQTSGWHGGSHGSMMDWGIGTLYKDIPSPNKVSLPNIA